MMKEPETVSCIHCGKQTLMLGTQMCDNCYEIDLRISYMGNEALTSIINKNNRWLSSQLRNSARYEFIRPRFTQLVVGCDYEVDKRIINEITINDNLLPCDSDSLDRHVDKLMEEYKDDQSKQE